MDVSVWMNCICPIDKVQNNNGPILWNIDHSTVLFVKKSLVWSRGKFRIFIKKTRVCVFDVGLLMNEAQS